MKTLQKWPEYKRVGDTREWMKRTEAAKQRLEIALAALKQFEGFWRSGNAVPVERAVIRADHPAVTGLYDAIAAIGEIPK